MITYEGLPVSSGGAHKVKDKNLKSAWEKCNQFISEIACELEEDKYKLDLYLGCKQARKYFWKYLLKFGFPSKIDFISTKDWYARWSIPKRLVAKVVDELSNISSFPKYWIGPIHFYREGKFLLKDPETKTAIPGQRDDYNFEDDYEHKTAISNFRINLSDKVSISTWLVLPFDERTEEFDKIISFFIEISPFRLSEKHWRKWQYSKNNKLYSSVFEMNLTNHSSVPAKNAGGTR